MNKNVKLSLMAVAGLLLVTALWNQYRLHWHDLTETKPLLFPSLLENIEQLSGIELATNSETVNLVKVEGQWQVQERYNYAARDEHINALLKALVNARKQEQKTANPKYYNQLAVNDISEADSKAVQVTLSFSGDIEPLSILVGREMQGWEGHFVRKPTEAQSWLLDTVITVYTTAGEWLKHDITRIPVSRVQQVRNEPANNRLPVTVFRTDPDKNTFQLNEQPANTVIKYASLASVVPNALAHFNMSDIYPAEDKPLDKKQSNTSYFATFDGLLVEVQSQEINGEYYAAVKFGFDEKRAEATLRMEAAKAAASGEKIEEKENVLEEALRLNKQHKDWVYRIPDYSYRYFSKSMDEFLDPA